MSEITADCARPTIKPGTALPKLAPTPLWQGTPILFFGLALILLAKRRAWFQARVELMRFAPGTRLRFVALWLSGFGCASVEPDSMPER